MKPYSKELKSRVLAAVDAGKLGEEVAKTFSVSMLAGPGGEVRALVEVAYGLPAVHDHDRRHRDALLGVP